MELENWLLQHDVKEMVMNDLKYYLEESKKDGDEYYYKLFQGKDLKKFNYVLHSVSYVINDEMRTIDDEEVKYIHAKVKLEYCGTAFAEYGALYDLNGDGLDDYFRTI